MHQQAGIALLCSPRLGHGEQMLAIYIFFLHTKKMPAKTAVAKRTNVPGSGTGVIDLQLSVGPPGMAAMVSVEPGGNVRVPTFMLEAVS